MYETLPSVSDDTSQFVQTNKDTEESARQESDVTFHSYEDTYKKPYNSVSAYYQSSVPYSRASYQSPEGLQENWHVGALFGSPKSLDQLKKELLDCYSKQKSNDFGEIEINGLIIPTKAFKHTKARKHYYYSVTVFFHGQEVQRR